MGNANGRVSGVRGEEERVRRTIHVNCRKRMALPSASLLDGIPHAEGVSFVGFAHRLPSITKPPIGTSRNNCHHPLLPISCNRREPAARKGSKVATRNTLVNDSFKYANAAAARVTKRVNYQNSARVARPLKSAYFVKHT